MLRWLIGGSSRNKSKYQAGADRGERNAVIKRIVSAAAAKAAQNAAEAGPCSPTTDEGTPASASTGQHLPQDQIASRAYEIWVRNGRPTGTADRDWMQAIRELEAERAAVASAPSGQLVAR